MKQSSNFEESGLSFVGKNVFLMMGISLILSLLCTSLFIVGFSAAVSIDLNSIKMVSWIHTSTRFQSVTSNQYFGLLGIYTTITSSRTSTVSNYVSYDDNKCGINIAVIDDITTSYCKKCAQAGQEAFFLVLVSIFLSAAVVLSGLVRMLVANTHLLKFLSILSSALIILFTFIAFISWSTNCYSNVQSEVLRDAPDGSLIDVSYFVGFNSVVTGFVFMVGVLVVHILTPSYNSDQIDGDIYSASNTKKNPLSKSVQREADMDAADDADNNDDNDDNNVNDDINTHGDIETPIRKLKQLSSYELGSDFGCEVESCDSNKTLIEESKV